MLRYLRQLSAGSLATALLGALPAASSAPAVHAGDYEDSVHVGAATPAGHPVRARRAGRAAPTDRVDGRAPSMRFYRTPHHLPAAHGAVLRRARYDGPLSPRRARNTLVLHSLRGLDDEMVASSAFVSVPRGTLPGGGWPLVTWGYGTTGVADTCAPTVAASEPADPSRQRPDPVLGRSWVGGREA